MSRMIVVAAAVTLLTALTGCGAHRDAHRLRHGCQLVHARPVCNCLMLEPLSDGGGGYTILKCWHQMPATDGHKP